MSPVPVDTTGSPEANASRMETGWLSITDELTKMSALSYSAGTSGGSTRPANRMPSAPSRIATCRRRTSSLP